MDGFWREPSSWLMDISSSCVLRCLEREKERERESALASLSKASGLSKGLTSKYHFGHYGFDICILASIVA